MAGSGYGTNFRITTWGETHGAGVGVVVDGCPAGLSLDREDVQKYLDRRKPGQSKYTTQRKEGDQVEILSGVFEGKTTGTPISMVVYNKDQRSKDYSNIKDVYRPGHADFTFDMKYVPDAIICDVMMPVMDGLECCRKLKMELQTSHIPVMLLTACSLDEQRIQGFECGADSYISKPFNSKLLLVRLRNLIDNHKRLKQFFGDKITLSKESVSEVDKGFVERFRELIEANLIDSELSVEELGSKMGLSRVQLYRKIKALTNYSPNELVRIARLKKAASLLASSEKTISEITYEVGFTSPSYFTKCYKEYFGESPTDFLKRRG